MEEPNNQSWKKLEKIFGEVSSPLILDFGKSYFKPNKVKNLFSLKFYDRIFSFVLGYSVRTGFS